MRPVGPEALGATPLATATCCVAVTIRLHSSVEQLHTCYSSLSCETGRWSRGSGDSDIPAVAVECRGVAARAPVLQAAESPNINAVSCQRSEALVHAVSPTMQSTTTSLALICSIDTYCVYMYCYPNCVTGGFMGPITDRYKFSTGQLHIHCTWAKLAAAS